MDIASQVRSSLQGQGLPAPTLAWVRSVMPNRNPMPPLPALTATAKARLMATDITNAGVLDVSASAFPPNITNQEVKETRLSRDVLVQVLDIDNLTKSKWEQVEELEAIARGEQTRGREVIRLPAAGEEDEEGSVSSASTQAIATGPNLRGGPPGSGTTPKNSTHRLVLQDWKGQRVYGLELKRIDKIGVGTLNIGEKILLKKGTVVARGMVLLEPTMCTIVGGKVEAWQKAWVDGRLTRLREAAGLDVQACLFRSLAAGGQRIKLGYTFSRSPDIAMRLLNSVTFELQEFVDNEIPTYAILSHTWGRDEVTFSELEAAAKAELGMMGDEVVIKVAFSVNPSTYVPIHISRSTEVPLASSSEAVAY
ncbi:RecQ mediated genome instability protein Rmi1 [Seiridium cupressi]